MPKKWTKRKKSSGKKAALLSVEFEDNKYQRIFCDCLAFSKHCKCFFMHCIYYHFQNPPFFLSKFAQKKFIEKFAQELKVFDVIHIKIVL